MGRCDLFVFSFTPRRHGCHFRCRYVNELLSLDHASCIWALYLSRVCNLWHDKSIGMIVIVQISEV